MLLVGLLLLLLLLCRLRQPLQCATADLQAPHAHVSDAVRQAGVAAASSSPESIHVLLTMWHGEHGAFTVADGSEAIVVLGADGRSSAVAKRGNASADAASSTRSGLDTDLGPNRPTQSVHARAMTCASRKHTASNCAATQHAGTRDPSDYAQGTGPVRVPLAMLKGAEPSEVRRPVGHTRCLHCASTC